MQTEVASPCSKCSLFLGLDPKNCRHTYLIIVYKHYSITDWVHTRNRNLILISRKVMLMQFKDFDYFLKNITH